MRLTLEILDRLGAYREDVKDFRQRFPNGVEAADVLAWLRDGRTDWLVWLTGCWAVPMLAAGADPRAADERGLTPLHWAAISGRAECVAALLASGSDPRAADERGLTPLHWAAEYGHADCVALLEAK